MGRQARLLRHPEECHPRYASPHASLVSPGAQLTYARAERIESNFQQVELPDEDFETLTNLGRKTPKRFNVKTTYPVFWDINIFNDDAEKTATNQIKVV